jgi:hypothetical protein
MTMHDGRADFLTPDGQHMVVTVHAGLRNGRWSGSLSLPDAERRLEQGDVCRISADPLGELRVIITEQRGSRRYTFIALIDPDPRERLEPPL